MSTAVVQNRPRNPISIPASPLSLDWETSDLALGQYAPRSQTICTWGPGQLITLRLMEVWKKSYFWARERTSQKKHCVCRAPEGLDLAFGPGAVAAVLREAKIKERWKERHKERGSRCVRFNFCLPERSAVLSVQPSVKTDNFNSCDVSRRVLGLVVSRRSICLFKSITFDDEIKGDFFARLLIKDSASQQRKRNDNRCGIKSRGQGDGTGRGVSLTDDPNVNWVSISALDAKSLVLVWLMTGYQIDPIGDKPCLLSMSGRSKK